MKKSIARLDALDQIKKYINELVKDKKDKKIVKEKIKGVILAKSIDPELSKALKNETNIKARTYFFSIDIQ